MIAAPQLMGLFCQKKKPVDIRRSLDFKGFSVGRQVGRPAESSVGTSSQVRYSNFLFALAGKSGLDGLMPQPSPHGAAGLPLPLAWAACRTTGALTGATGTTAGASWAWPSCSWPSCSWPVEDGRPRFAVGVQGRHGVALGRKGIVSAVTGLIVIWRRLGRTGCHRLRRLLPLLGWSGRRGWTCGLSRRRFGCWILRGRGVFLLIR